MAIDHEEIEANRFAAELLMPKDVSIINAGEGSQRYNPWLQRLLLIRRY